MFTLEKTILQAAEQQSARQAARQDEILSNLSPEDRAVFDTARRCSCSVGAAMLAVENHQRRVARKLASQPRKPTAPRPTARPTALSFPRPATAKSYPVDACRLKAGTPFELLAAGSGSTAGPVVAKVLARSGRGIATAYWGTLVHDLSGRQQVRDRLSLDYCHDPAEILGFAEAWRVEGGNLVCTAVLMPGESKRAKEVVDLARRGVPYEASISFWPLAVEELKPGMTATINGLAVTGPASIIRRWRLSSLAICPRGADSNTKTEIPSR